MRKLLSTAVLALTLAAPAAAQGIMAEMHRDLNEVQQKMIDLAKAIPAEKYDWRPGPGVRSVREVFLHVSGENYQLPIYFGRPAPATTGITTDFATTGAYEKKPLTKDQVVAELTASFTNLHQGLALNTDSNLGESIKFFGQDWTRARASVLTVTHLHEHLGQLIAYARQNSITPPWSR